MKKILFFDIDGVLTSTNKYLPNTSPKLTNKSINVLKKAIKNNFEIVFITARSVRELRIKNGFENQLKKHKLIKKSLIFGALGLDMASHEYEFKTKNGEIIKKNGSAVFERKPVIKRETFSNLDHYILYKMLLGREIKQELKYAGFKIKPAIVKELMSDVRIFFELEDNSKSNRKKMVKELEKIISKQREIFNKTKKFGSPIDLIVKDIGTAISIEPKELGKHLGVLRALNYLKVSPKEKILSFAFGDNESDKKMSIRKDIKFIKVKNNSDFVKKINTIIEKY